MPVMIVFAAFCLVLFFGFISAATNYLVIPAVAKQLVIPAAAEALPYYMGHIQ